MTISRRKFINSIGIASGAVLLAHSSCAKRPVGPAVSPEDWEQVRRQFDLDWDYVHMSCFLLASHPKPVRQAIERHRRGLDENPVRYYRENAGVYEEKARLTAASYLYRDHNTPAHIRKDMLGTCLCENDLMTSFADRLAIQARATGRHTTLYSDSVFPRIRT